MYQIETPPGHAVNLLAVNLARENERLAARVAELEAELTRLNRPPERITLGDLEINLRSGVAWRGGSPVAALTPTERQLLVLLATSSPDIVSYTDIGRAIWPGVAIEDVQRSCMVHLSRMRDKLDPSPIELHGTMRQSRHFRTMQGYGIGVQP